MWGRRWRSWLGRLRFTALYLLSALGGSVLVYLLSPLNAATAGASGAVFGLFGASFVVGKRLNLDVRWVIGLIAINLAFTFVIPLLGGQNISWQGHIGGLVTGAVVAAVYAYVLREHRALIQISADGRPPGGVRPADLVADNRTAHPVRRRLTSPDVCPLLSG